MGTANTHRITLLQVRNGKAELPIDYRLATQVAGRPIKQPCDCNEYPEWDCCKGRYKDEYQPTQFQTITQWTQKAFQEDCDIEINLLCTKCGERNCGCNNGTIEVEVDRIWELSHPEFYYKHFDRARRIGEGHGSLRSFYHPKFQILRSAQHNMFNVENILPDCPNVHCANCIYSYNISPPYIEVDFHDGEILLSYLGVPLDEEQNTMVPNHPALVEALEKTLIYRVFQKRYFKHSQEADRRKYLEAKQDAAILLNEAYAILSTLPYNEMRDWLEANWFQRLKRTKLRQGERSTTSDPYRLYGVYLNQTYGNPPRNIPQEYRRKY